MERTKPPKRKPVKPVKVKAEPLTEESIMTFGMFKGKKLATVEYSYLKWFYYENYGKANGFYKLLINYIEDNKEIILK